MVKHVNTGTCPKCAEILSGVDQSLVDWFKELQSRLIDAHVAWGLRGQKDQNDAYAKKTSKAKWGESPHNFGLAVDLFRITHTGAEWMSNWYTDTIAPEIAKNPNLTWGGTFPKFRDLPHIELKNWKELVQKGLAKLCQLP